MNIRTNEEGISFVDFDDEKKPIITQELLDKTPPPPEGDPLWNMPTYGK